VAAPARAAWLLAAGLLAAPLLPEPLPEAGCPSPGALDPGAVHTRAVGCAGGAPLRGPARLLFGLRLDPNRADAESLQSLPGIGPARAAAIVAERERRPFASVEALIRVHGIGPRTVERLRPWLALAPAEVSPQPGSG
jgi:competence ComEA-like helix-hairpin-helix protein